MGHGANLSCVFETVGHTGRGETNLVGLDQHFLNEMQKKLIEHIRLHHMA